MICTLQCSSLEDGLSYLFIKFSLVSIDFIDFWIFSKCLLLTSLSQLAHRYFIFISRVPAIQSKHSKQLQQRSWTCYTMTAIFSRCCSHDCLAHCLGHTPPVHWLLIHCGLLWPVFHDCFSLFYFFVLFIYFVLISIKSCKLARKYKLCSSLSSAWSLYFIWLVFNTSHFYRIFVLLFKLTMTSHTFAPSCGRCILSP
jgi:hypothetical protein